MALYTGSTQEEHWFLSRGEVVARRMSAIGRNRDPGDTFTLKEESILHRHHEERVLRFASRMSIPDKVAATAITYYKRFYLGRSVLDYNPSVIALSAIYAGCKVEEVILSADDLATHFDTILNGLDPKSLEDRDPMKSIDSVDGTAMSISSEMLLNWELQFLNMLRFHLICYHPYRSLSVIQSKIESDPHMVFLTDPPPLTSKAGDHSGSSKTSRTVLNELMHLARTAITGRALFTDLQFTHSPAAIAMACIVCAARQLTNASPANLPNVTSSELETRLLNLVDSEIRDEILEVVTDIENVPSSNESVSDIKALELRRKKLCLAQNDPTTELYQELERQQSEQLEDKRLKKSQQQRELMQQRTNALMGFDE